MPVHRVAVGRRHSDRRCRRQRLDIQAGIAGGGAGGTAAGLSSQGWIGDRGVSDSSAVARGIDEGNRGPAVGIDLRHEAAKFRAPADVAAQQIEHLGIGHQVDRTNDRVAGNVERCARIGQGRRWIAAPLSV